MELHGYLGRTKTAVRAQLRDDAMDMILDRVQGNTEAPRDLFVT
jgi:hypothetical protein